MLATPTNSADWQLLMPKGEFPVVDEAGRERVQVFDEAALFAVEENFRPKILIDRDHCSYDLKQPTEAYGWGVAVENRADGLWGQIEWTDLGQSVVPTQRFRFLSPAFRPEDLQPLGGNRFRPLRLDTAALTNKPNIAAMPPLLLNRAKGDKTFGGRSNVRPVLNANRGIPVALRNRGSYISGVEFINEIRKTRGGTFEEAWEATRPMMNRFSDRGHALVGGIWAEATANEQDAFDRTLALHENSGPDQDRGSRIYRSGVQPKEQFLNAIRKLMAERSFSFEQSWNHLAETEPLFWLRHVFTITSNGEVG